MTRRSLQAGLAAALLATAARAGEPRCELRVSAEPPELALGAHARATIRVRGAERPPRLQASSGTLGALRADGAGGFVAEYAPPEETHPRVAIVVASGAGCGWTALRLLGAGVAVARAAPNVEVSVVVAETVFGPARTDAGGVARIPIVAPPGVKVAHRLGTGEEIPLRVPDVEHVLATAERREVRADREEEILVRVFAVDDGGAPLRDAALEVAVSSGRLDALAPTDDAGVYAARWRLPPGAPATAEVRARLRGERPVSRDDVRTVAGPVRRVALDVSPAPLRAGEERDVRVTLSDAAGNAAAETPRIAATAGTTAPPERLAAGVWRTRLAAPGVLGGATSIGLAVNAGEATASLELPVAPGAAEAVRLEGPRSVVADGRRAVRVRVAVTDRFGNPVPAEAPAVHADLGELGAPIRDASGVWTYPYRPLRLEAPARATVRAAAGALAGDTHIELERAPRRLGIAPLLGAASGAGLVTLLAGVSATSWRGEGSRLELGAEASWFALARREPITVGATSLPLRARADFVTLLASASWRIPLGARTAAWATAGAGGARLVASAASGTQPDLREAGFVPAAQLGVGAGVRALGTMPFVELRLARHWDAGLDTFRGALLTTSLAVGVRLDAR